MGRINKEPKGNIKTLKKEKLKAMGFRQERIEGMNQPSPFAVPNERIRNQGAQKQVRIRIRNTG